jgi:hypothetical protein
MFLSYFEGLVGIGFEKCDIENCGGGVAGTVTVLDARRASRYVGALRQIHPATPLTFHRARSLQEYPAIPIETAAHPGPSREQR